MGKNKNTKITVFNNIKVRCCPGCASMMEYKKDDCWLCKGCKANWEIKRMENEN